jgi:hypothetical protein
MTWELENEPEAEDLELLENPTQLVEVSSDSAFAESQLITTPEAVAVDVLTASTRDAEPAADEWLTDELLERVFG